MNQEKDILYGFLKQAIKRENIVNTKQHASFQIHKVKIIRNATELDNTIVLGGFLYVLEFER